MTCQLVDKLDRGQWREALSRQDRTSGCLGLGEVEKMWARYGSPNSSSFGLFFLEMKEQEVRIHGRVMLRMVFLC